MNLLEYKARLHPQQGSQQALGLIEIPRRYEYKVSCQVAPVCMATVYSIIIIDFWYMVGFLGLILKEKCHSFHNCMRKSLDPQVLLSGLLGQ